MFPLEITKVIDDTGRCVEHRILFDKGRFWTGQRWHDHGTVEVTWKPDESGKMIKIGEKHQ